MEEIRRGLKRLVQLFVTTSFFKLPIFLLTCTLIRSNPFAPPVSSPTNPAAGLQSIQGCVTSA